MTHLNDLPSAGSPNRSRALHALALLTLCATFPLIFMGGLVTTHQAGMSVPDWPNSYGYNMFLFPPSKWVGGIFYEHTHRLMGSFVGFCAVMLTLAAWGPAATARGRRRIVWISGGLLIANAVGTAAMILWPAAFKLPANTSIANIAEQGSVTAGGILLCSFVGFAFRSREPRRWVRWLATGCLAAVCVQGLLGGLRVDLVNLPLAIVHGCFAQATFCLMVLIAAVTGSWWAEAADESLSLDGRAGRGLVVLAIVAVVIVYGQLIVGATMRHLQAGLAIPTVLVYGHLLPPTTAAGVAAINHQRAWNYHLPPVTLTQLWLHMGHRLGAAVVTVAVLTLCITIFSKFRRTAALAVPAAGLLVLLLTQLTLGVLTVYFRKPADITSAHVAVGALVLATTFLIAVRAIRLYSLAAQDSARLEQSQELALASER